MRVLSCPPFGQVVPRDIDPAAVGSFFTGADSLCNAAAAMPAIVRFPSARMAMPTRSSIKQASTSNPEGAHCAPDEPAAAPASGAIDAAGGGPTPGPARGLSGVRLLKSKPRRKTVSPERTSPQRSVSVFTLLRAALGFSHLRGSARVADLGDQGPSSLDEAKLRLCAAGKDDDWEARMAAMRALPELLEALAADSDRLQAAADSLGAPVVKQLGDLRSAIVRAACALLERLTLQHGHTMAPLVAAALPQLLTNLALLKVFASASSRAATVALQKAPSTAALRALVAASRDAKKQTRQGALELMGVLLQVPPDSSFQVPPKGLAAALGALGTSTSTERFGVTDPDGAVRTAAARAFWAARRSYPGKMVDGWLAQLADKERKLVDRQQPRDPDQLSGAPSGKQATRYAAASAAAAPGADDREDAGGAAAVDESGPAIQGQGGGDAGSE